MKIIVEIGNKYGHLTIIDEAIEFIDGHKRIYCICECDCENHTIVKKRKDTLKYNNNPSCGCARINDLTGKKFGQWTVVKRDFISKRTRWWCQCECGTIKSIQASSLCSGDTTSCGCSNTYEDLTGQIFGRLTVIKLYDKTYYKIKNRTDKTTRIRWLCICTCGNKTMVSTYQLKSGKTVSCGCYREEIKVKHGKSYDRLYTIYNNMISRCYNPNDQRYYTHGARGIIVCDQWLPDNKYTGMNNFYEWAFANGYQKDLTIDRINNDGNYEPLNCRWADIFMQSNNKRSNHMITYNGKTQTLTQWAREYNIKNGTLGSRINNLKWSIEKALNTPVTFYKKENYHE